MFGNSKITLPEVCVIQTALEGCLCVENSLIKDGKLLKTLRKLSNPRKSLAKTMSLPVSLSASDVYFSTEFNKPLILWASTNLCESSERRHFEGLSCLTMKNRTMPNITILGAVNADDKNRRIALREQHDNKMQRIIFSASWTLEQGTTISEEDWIIEEDESGQHVTIATKRDIPVTYNDWTRRIEVTELASLGWHLCDELLVSLVKIDNDSLVDKTDNVLWSVVDSVLYMIRTEGDLDEVEKVLQFYATMDEHLATHPNADCCPKELLSLVDTIIESYYDSDSFDDQDTEKVLALLSAQNSLQILIDK
jgi:hypothetical protein